MCRVQASVYLELHQMLLLTMPLRLSLSVPIFSFSCTERATTAKASRSAGGLASTWTARIFFVHWIVGHQLYGNRALATSMVHCRTPPHLNARAPLLQCTHVFHSASSLSSWRVRRL